MRGDYNVSKVGRVKKGWRKSKTETETETKRKRQSEDLKRQGIIPKFHYTDSRVCTINGSDWLNLRRSEA
jgi:hypothetical protein